MVLNVKIFSRNIIEKKTEIINNFDVNLALVYEFVSGSYCYSVYVVFGLRLT